MKKALIISLSIILIVFFISIFMYFTIFQINENDVRKAISNYLYEDKAKECNSDSLDNRVYGNYCEDYYGCYGNEFSNNVDGSQVNEIKNRLMEKGFKFSIRLTYEDVKIIPKIENHDQYDIYDINNKCFLQVYENKGLISSNNARDYFVTISKNVFQKNSLQSESFCSNIYKITDVQTCEKIIDCLINAINSDMSLSEVTALANFLKSEEEKYYLAGFEIFNKIKVIPDSNLQDFIEQCGNV